MKFILTMDYDDMSRKAANIIGAQMILKNNSRAGSGNRFHPYLNL